MKAVVFVLGMLSSAFVYSQGFNYYGGTGHFSMGSSVVEMNSVNGYLNSKGLPGFSRNCLSIGGGGFGIINNFLIGGEGGAIDPSRVASTTGNAELSTGYGMFNVGYMVPLKSRLMVYAMGGIGWGGSDLTLVDANGKEEKYNARKSFVSTEINLDMYMFGDKESGAKAGFKTGFCIGYLFNPQTNPWSDNNSNYTNIPNTFVNGFYFKLKIGGGGFGIKK